MKDAFFTYDTVNISFDGKAVVKDVSFSVNKGEILCLVGESGSGKSTIIKSIMGILNEDAGINFGRIIFEGTDLLKKSDKELRAIRGSQIGMIFQDAKGSLCPIRTIGDQIVEAISAHEKIDKKIIKERTISIFERLNFSEPQKLWDSYPFELSGGMNQRVAIAMSMLLKPLLLLADEPTSALDANATKKVINELKELRDDYGMSIILVTHDMAVVSEIADTVLVLKDGRQVEYGTCEDVLKRPKSDYTKLLLSAVPKFRSDGWNLSLQ